MAMEPSPDSKCPICLDRFDNTAYLGCCFHKFCFCCIQEWSKNIAECPLCKQPFFSIFHTIRSEDDFQEYILTPSENIPFGSPIVLSIDSNDSDSTSDNYIILECVESSSPRPLELLELFSDSEGSIGEENREDMKKEQSVQCCRRSDHQSSRGSSTCSPLYKENVSSCRSALSSVVEKTDSKDEEKNKDKDLSPQESIWSSSSERNILGSPSSHRCSRKRKTRSPQASSQNRCHSHAHQSRREHASKHQAKKRQSKTRDVDKYQCKRSRSRSRTHDASLFPKSKRGSLPQESTMSRDSSTLQSHESCGKWRSRSRDSDHYCRRDSYQSRHQWAYASQSQKAFGDGSSCRRKTQSKACCSRPSASPECKTERTDLHRQQGLYERHDCCYEQRRPRSRSSTRSRSPSGGTDRMKSEKRGGKRKHKTRHLENAVKGSSGPETEKDSKKTFSKFSDCYKNEDSLSDD